MIFGIKWFLTGTRLIQKIILWLNLLVTSDLFEQIVKR